MHITTAIPGGFSLTFESADIDAWERMFGAIRAQPLPQFVDEIQGYADAIAAAASPASATCCLMDGGELAGWLVCPADAQGAIAA